MKHFRDFFVVCFLNIKNIITNRLTIGVLGAFSVLFLLVSTTMIKEYETKSSIPIGVIDEDQTKMSKGVLKRLQTIDGVLVNEMDQEDAKEALREERILAVFIIKEGYEKQVKNYVTSDLVSMEYLKDYDYISIISDIFAKAMMPDICLYRGEMLLGKINKAENLSFFPDYVMYTKDMKLLDNYEFHFDFNYYKIDGAGMSTSNEVKNTMLSNQLFVGLIAIFITFFLMFLVMCLRKGKQVNHRMRINLISNVVVEVASVGTIFLISILTSLLLSVYMSMMLPISYVKDGMSVFRYLLGFSFVIAFVFLLLSKVIKSEIVYQFVAVFAILVFGGLSIMYAIGQLDIFPMMNFVKNVPNYWFIERITDIILKSQIKENWYLLLSGGLLATCYSIITYMKYRYSAR